MSGGDGSVVEMENGDTVEGIVLFALILLEKGVANGSNSSAGGQLGDDCC
jgi:hypothetical protein